MAFSLNDFVIQQPRILPVIIAVDKSGSMSANGKIEALNIALKNFINSMKNEDDERAVIHTAIYSFGRDVSCDVELQDVTKVEAPTYQAAGKTPLGETLKKIKLLIEDKNLIPSRSYRPTVVVISDGKPTDDYIHSMEEFINEGRSSKAFRIAMSIGDDANKKILSKFVSESHFLVDGEDASDITKFFQFVTMTVTQRIRSQNPDKPITAGILDSNDLMEL